MNKYCKNETFKNLFEKFYNKYANQIENFPNKFLDILNSIDASFNSLSSYLYNHNTDSKENRKNCYDHLFVTECNQKLSAISQDLKKILRENYKIKSEDLDISKHNSDVVFIEKEEADNYFKISNQNENRNILLDQNKEIFLEISNSIKKLENLTKIPDNSGIDLFNF